MPPRETDLRAGSSHWPVTQKPRVQVWDLLLHTRIWGHRWVIPSFRFTGPPPIQGGDYIRILFHKKFFFFFFFHKKFFKDCCMSFSLLHWVSMPGFFNVQNKVSSCQMLLENIRVKEGAVCRT